MKFFRSIFILLVVFLLMNQSLAQAFVFINEILADPANGISGDANGDGVRSSSDDEFIELFNNSNNLIDLSGWSLRDSASTRHIFSNNSSIMSQGYFVIFGGGVLPVKNNWQKSSTGTLSLNNTSDTISLFNQSNQLVDQVSYGSLANNDQSIVNKNGEFVLHSSEPGSQGSLFSPGDGLLEERTTTTSTPEPTSLTCLALAGVGVLLKGRKSI